MYVGSFYIEFYLILWLNDPWIGVGVFVDALNGWGCYLCDFMREL